MRGEETLRNGFVCASLLFAAGCWGSESPLELSTDGASAADSMVVPVTDGAPPDAPDNGLYRFPIAGELDTDLFIGYYVDHDPTVSTTGGYYDNTDYTCGPKSWDGWEETSIFLRDFAAMRAGVDVMSARPGTVMATHDGEPDLNAVYDIELGLGNYITIAHDDGLTGTYSNLAMGSLLVTEGDSVGKGQVIARVGSSGASELPHLGFALKNGDTVVDPFSGECGPMESLWEAEPAHDMEFKLTNSGLTNAPNVPWALVVQPPPQVDTFGSADVWASMWIFALNIPVGSTRVWSLFDPEGNVFAGQTWEHPAYYPASWWYFPVRVSDMQAHMPGTWRFSYTNGAVQAEHLFTVEPPAMMLSLPPSPMVEARAGGGPSPGFVDR